MARGLPVLGSDWDGYRDLVVDGETGFLVPTRMVRGATARGDHAAGCSGQVNYDHFLAECMQAAAVDPAAAADALTRLVADAELRRRMGAAGRDRAVGHFRWERVVRAYEDLWAEQERAVRRGPRRLGPGPAWYPAPEHSFAGHPSACLTDADRVQAAPDAEALLAPFLRQPLTNVSGERAAAGTRGRSSGSLRSADRARSVGELAADLERAGADPAQARATVAWLLKYGLLRPVT